MFRYSFLRRFHRWLALSLGLFLIVQGLTGTAIAFRHELDVFLNPELLRVADADEMQQSPSDLLARLNNLPRYANPSMLELPEGKNDVLVASYKSTSNTRQVMVNPYSGAILGERNWGEPGLSRPLIVPTLLYLHRQLLAGEIGKTIVSINAILLAMVTISGMCLWWPVWRLKAWWQAVTLPNPLSGQRVNFRAFNFRLHRAAGFYSAPVFLMLAVTGLSFNKPHWLIGSGTGTTKPVVVAASPTRQALPLEEIIRIAQQAFPEAKISRINLPGMSRAVYEIRLLQPDELRRRTGATRVTVDAADGAIIRIQDPLTAKKWEWFSSYFFPLHSGEVAGFAGKIAISLFGLMPLLFAVSGTLIWLRRRAKVN